MGDESRQEVELLGGDIDEIAVDANLASRDVDAQALGSPVLEVPIESGAESTSGCGLADTRLSLAAQGRRMDAVGDA